tara:strand:- start:2367 stop:2747 length:381 start_codon:yes stop_codon:yes gene_type:complete
MKYIIIFLLLFLNIYSINANQFKDNNKNLSLNCNYAPRNFNHQFIYVPNYKVTNILPNGYEFNYTINEESDNFVHAFFIQKKDNMYKKFTLEINLSSLVISDNMYIGKDLINMKLKDHKKFLCKEF